ncbi:MAG TPA: acyl-CoA dehydrogenase family protein [Mycobacteriales bacterium]|nr:acyl-CoA dehydrogenase family protein [Mycobacteriales bacterium]
MSFDAEVVRAEVREWLAANWDPDSTLAEWREKLCDSGWGCPTWPQQWCGRGLPAAAQAMVSAEFARVGGVAPPEGVGMQLASPTLLEHGSDDLKARFLRDTVAGRIIWCQLFSEPSAGSDLAGLTTRAVRDGDDWVVNGQKVWNTSARHADYGLLLARTDPGVPKHRGLTYFVLPMKQPGVEVRPLRQMNGHASFNEVFLSDARLPADYVIGEVGGGWAVALTTLAHERRMTIQTQPVAKDGGRVAREAYQESLQLREPYKWYPQRAGRVDLAIERAKSHPGGPTVRREVARLFGLASVSRWTAERAAAARAVGKPPGPEGSLGKLANSNVARAAMRVHAMLAGPEAMLAGADGPADGLVAEILLSVPAVSIAGGADEIQRNIIGERVLGLPKEPSVDTTIPFAEVQKNATRLAKE